jgi:RES domain-containing protein
VPRKKSRTPPRRPATPKNDPYLLDEFSHQDLGAWKRNSALLHQYRVKQFYELESLREIHRSALSDALRTHGYVSMTVKGWTRIVDYRYSLEPLSAKGSMGKGGRFNIGRDLDLDLFAAFPALYMASNYDTAYAERFGPPIPGSSIQPHELALRHSSSFSNVALTGEIHCLFDLRDPSTVKEFSQIIGKFRMNKELQQIARKLDMKGSLLIYTGKDLYKSLLGNWRDMPVQYGLPSNSQVFARFLRQAGFEGVIYPSTKGEGECIALFLDQLDGSDAVIELADKPPPQVVITRLDAKTATDLY